MMRLCSNKTKYKSYDNVEVPQYFEAFWVVEKRARHARNMEIKI